VVFVCDTLASIAKDFAAGRSRFSPHLCCCLPFLIPRRHAIAPDRIERLLQNRLVSDPQISPDEDPSSLRFLAPILSRTAATASSSRLISPRERSAFLL